MKQPAKYSLIHTIILLICVGLAYFWTKSESLTRFSLQLISFSVIIYMAFQFIAKKTNLPKNNKITADVIILSFTTFLIIFSTGALYSPLFFLVYFLLFGISLLFEPLSAVTLAVISVVFFLLTPQKEIFAEFLQLASLFLITPLALIFGTQYIQLLQSNEKIKILTIKDKELEKEVKGQEEEVKIWTDKELKNRLIKIWETLDSLITDGSFNNEHKNKLQEISGNLSKLLESGEKMKEKIEE